MYSVKTCLMDAGAKLASLLIFCLFSNTLFMSSAWAADNYVTLEQPPKTEAVFDLSEYLALPEQTMPEKPEWLGPVISVMPESKSLEKTYPMIDSEHTWQPIIAPILLAPESVPNVLSTPALTEPDKVSLDKIDLMATKKFVDEHPKPPKIAILIDDLGYNRRGMEASLALPIEVALAILPETPYAHQTATRAQAQLRTTLLHAPMENQRELKLGPGGLYAKMSEQELKAVLIKDLEGLPGIQGANNHMGSLLTTKPESMKWVMEVLKERALFFIDSLTSPDSVAEKTAQEYGLKTVRRDVFLDNIRTEKAIDRQFSRLLKLARRHGSALAIGHPYPETMSYLQHRLVNLQQDGVHLVALSELLALPTPSGTAKK
ncbi:divergent polysaccharide deacetylase family protein [Marinomonas sp. TW1]|uniref:divergent polysaccharide deacetylase family protein n=1 Tax=Marinomonas sp. TW1 TaxID=1561203 RepID=UPI0007AFD803|nr:divergent polysaccharide deacetylase family protein [Marinomonas sp. TW1]KZN14182.1 hypothetical protein OA79_06910 [Marinomonas sp. TW1]